MLYARNKSEKQLQFMEITFKIFLSYNDATNLLFNPAGKTTKGHLIAEFFFPRKLEIGMT